MMYKGIIFIVIVSVVFILPIPEVCAKTKKEQLYERLPEGIKNSADFYYSDVGHGHGYILTNLVDRNVSNNLTILLIDKSGKIALYPMLNTRYKCVQLKNHTLFDILSHWNCFEKKKRFYRFTFKGWSKSRWEVFQIDMKFKNYSCVAFRVNSTLPIKSDWIDTKDIPLHKDCRTNQGKVLLPVELGCVEGPRDMSNCGPGPSLSIDEAQAYKLGKCAKNYVPPDYKN